MMVDKRVSTLLAVAQQRSTLTRVNPCCSLQSVAYSPYGYHPELTITLGFNGERLEPITGYYLLGNGYRAFNPILMRFNSSDSMSPFDLGGENAYAYCQGNPVTRCDPSGHGLFEFVFSMARPYFSRVLSGTSRLPLGGAVQTKQVAVPSGSDKMSSTLTFLGFHASEEIHRGSLERGLSLNYSFRASQGRGFYYATTTGHANEYSAQIDKAGGKSHIYFVFADIRKWTYGVEYKKDAFGTPMIKPEGFKDVVVLFEIQEGQKPYILRSE
jgi:RHS repeat-associated protein